MCEQTLSNILMKITIKRTFFIHFFGIKAGHIRWRLISHRERSGEHTLQWFHGAVSKAIIRGIKKGVFKWNLGLAMAHKL